MVLRLPAMIKHFAEKYLADLGNSKSDLIPLYMAGFLLAPGKRSFTALGETVLEENRHKTAVSKFFRRKTFHSREIFEHLLGQLILEEIENYGMSKEWTLLIDGTCTRRGGFTKIGNAIQYREKDRNNKGNSTKAHTFVMGELISPRGMRYPIRYSFYTEEHCLETDISYRTQNDIAQDIVKFFRRILPYRTCLVVIADSYFDSKKMFGCINRKNTVFITSADRDRTCKLRYGTEKLHARAKDTKERKTFILTKGAESFTREQSRFSHPEMKGKMRQKYRITGEALNVSGIGKCRVVYSWKHKSGKKTGESFRVLLCSNPHWSDEKVAEMYALRWQIEIFFRELKSDLGLCDYSGREFDAYERYIDVCLMAFLFIEWYRLQSMRATRSRKERGQLRIIRTRGLKKRIRKEAVNEALQAVRKLKLVA